MDSEGLEIIAFGIAGCLMFGAFWLAVHVFDKWLFRFECACVEAVFDDDPFWASVLKAHREHIAAKSKRISDARRRGE